VGKILLSLQLTKLIRQHMQHLRLARVLSVVYKYQCFRPTNCLHIQWRWQDAASCSK